MIKTSLFMEYRMNHCMFTCACTNHAKCKIITINDSIEDMECLWYLCIFSLCAIVHCAGRIRVNCFVCVVGVQFNLRIFTKKRLPIYSIAQPILIYKQKRLNDQENVEQMNYIKIYGLKTFKIHSNIFKKTGFDRKIHLNFPACEELTESSRAIKNFVNRQP